MESMNHMPVLQLLTKIQTKQLSPQLLSARARQNVVEHLIGQGISVAEIASMLQVSDRTIVRDRKVIRGRNAVFCDEVGLTPRVAGFLFSHMEESVARLKRLQRDPNAAHRDKVYAERAMSYVVKEMTLRLQTLGYLPRVAESSSGDGARQPARLYEPPTEVQRARAIMDDKDYSMSLVGKLENLPLQASPRTEMYARTGESRAERRRRRKMEKRVRRAVACVGDNGRREAEERREVRTEARGHGGLVGG